MADTEKKTDEAEKTEAPAEEARRFESEAKTIGPCKVEVTIKVPIETITKEFDDRYKELISTVAFPGFRLGHAPRRLVEKRVGDDIRAEVKEHLVTESFKDAIERHEIDPLKDPDVDLAKVEMTDGMPMEYQAVFIVRPVVEVKDYAAITVTAAKPEVSESQVEAVLAGMRRRHAVLSVRSGEKVAEGDVAVLDVRATVGDEKVLERENVPYEHPDQFVAGLHLPAIGEAVLGKGADDEFTLTEKLPEGWPERAHAGKDMTVAFTVREVKRYELPELDDAFAARLDYDTLDELKTDVRKRVEREADAEAGKETDRRIVDALIAATPFEIPEDVVHEETDSRVKHLKAQLRMAGASEDEIERREAEAVSAERSEAERDLRAMFVLDAVARKEKILVTESEVRERISQMAQAYHRTVEEMEEYIEKRDMLSSIRASMREQKVMDLLKKTVKIEA